MGFHFKYCGHLCRLHIFSHYVTEAAHNCNYYINSSIVLSFQYFSNPTIGNILFSVNDTAVRKLFTLSFKYEESYSIAANIRFAAPTIHVGILPSDPPLINRC